ncbi:MAG: DUF2938 family protein [candidate division Zixibacteria bacterium]|nr:DUF2938 family protein [candidate division Zixibacteria bacterium]
MDSVHVQTNIHNTTPLRHENTAALISSYLIGIALAGVCLLLGMTVPAIHDRSWTSLVFGIATILLLWLWLYPSMGFGFLISKAPRRSPYIVTSLVNHTDFELDLMIWIVFLRRFVV